MFKHQTSFLLLGLVLASSVDSTAARRAKRRSTTPFGKISDMELALQSSVTTACETAALMGVFEGCKALSHNDKLPKLFRYDIAGLGVVQWSSLWIIVFGSGIVRAVVDGSLSAASEQLINPNEVPSESAGWYSSLKKPWFNPPGWLFPVMWLIISKPTQLIAFSRVANAITWKQLTLYGVYLSLGDTWNQVFFAFRRIRLGSIIIGAFWLSLLLTAVAFGSIDRAAGLLLLPTIGWVTVAAALNLGIYRLNGY